MKCSACHNNTHNIRTCPYNKQAAKKKNAHIKRDANRKRKQSEASTSSVGPSGQNKAPRVAPSHQFPRAAQFQQAPRVAPSQQLPRAAPSHHFPRAAPCQQAPRAAPSQAPVYTHQPRKSIARHTGGRLQHLLFGDNY
ncbi:unnamed protein product [Urochloa humidicola]